MLLASLGANDLRGLRPREKQIAYRRFATFPQSGIGSLTFLSDIDPSGVGSISAAVSWYLRSCG
jgi:hypothetical protein